MSPRNKKAGQRRLVDMSLEPADSAWSPDLPPVEEWYDSIPISESVSYSVRYAHDEYGRLTDWAVIQRRNTSDGYRRVAVYDACHGKSVHVPTSTTRLSVRSTNTRCIGRSGPTLSLRTGWTTQWSGS